ncbi:YDG domain-containing protein [uncultured Propionivibrio sp.]|uniref:YDG domain-containing protein n=1 Tax=uncultured Propionivibrio sp. TaxID=426737 RepID=UPI0029C0A022|nr:YDG domain-containing protein [uncultured Propionivibrio sp.]
MNRAYRLVWNERERRYVVAPETAKARSKNGRRRIVCATFACSLVTPALALDPSALPTGGSVTTGAASIVSSGNVMNVNQSSQKLAIDWSRFDIGANATVNFIQPSGSAIALNRVLGSDSSQIFGHLVANGQVFLINPNGVLFGKSAEVNVGGLVVATQNLSNADFMNGNYRFAGAAGSITNEGSLSGHYVALLGGQIANCGTIVARLGTAALAAGSDISLDFAGDGLTSVTVNRGTFNALVENKQLIQADGGTVLMTAKAADTLIQAVVNNEGVIEARTVDTSAGTIKLLADMDNGMVKVGGTLDASSSEGGKGGFVETSGQKMQVMGGATVRAKSWLIDPVDLTIDSTTASAIATSLNNNTDVTESATNNVTVASAVSWTSANTLTLDAGNNIAVNADITATNGTLKFYYGNGYTLGSGAKVNLSAGNHFYTKQGAGSESAWTVITDLGNAGDESSSGNYTLQGLAYNGNLAGRYVLGADIAAGGTSGWNTGAGFKPIGDSGTKFTGSFDGLGHAISGLVINRTTTDSVGLFGYVGAAASIAHLGLIGGSVTGRNGVGALVGSNAGDVVGSHATGSVSGSTNAGGLVGANYGNIRDSYASGSVASSGAAGGLAAYNEGLILYGYATGAVNGQSQTGGLVGMNQWNGRVSASYATGDVSGTTYVGGLVGNNIGIISATYATGSVVGNDTVGGLVGTNGTGFGYYGSILSSYATGWVNGSSNAGGLAGSNTGVISNSYWDADTSAQGTVGCGASDVTCGGGASALYSTSGSSALASATYTGAGWSFASSGEGASANGAWYMVNGYTRPYLAYFLKALTISASGTTKAFDGTTDASGAMNYSLETVDSGQLLGTLAASTASKNAGSYAVTPSGLYSTQQGYAIYYVAGTLTVTPANITVSTSDVTKTYDGTTNATGAATVTGGTLFGSDSLSGGSFAFSDKNAGTNNKTVTVSGVSVSDGNSGGNYNVSYASNTHSTINKANLTVSTSDVTKTYDGTTNATGAATVTGGTLFGSDSLSGGSFAFSDKNAGTNNKTVTVSGVSVSDGNSGGNYNVSYASNTHSTINKANLTVSTSDVTKTYDGTTNATGAATVTGGTLFGSDSLSGGSFAFSDKNAGTNNKTVTVSGVSVSDGNSGGNYNVSYASNTHSTINKANLTVSTSDVTKTYDGTTNATGAATVTGGTLFGSDSLSGGSFAFSDKNAGTNNKTVTVSGVSVSDGNSGGNYNVSYASNTHSTINKATLTFSAGATAASNKVYDGTTTAIVSGGSFSGLIGGDSVSLAQTGTFSDKNAGANKSVSYTSSLASTDAGNYVLSGGSGTTTASIAPATLTVTANSVTKTYNGAPYSSGNGVAYSGFGSGDSASLLSGTLTYGGTSQGATAAGNYTIRPGGLTANGNYTLAFVDGLLTITAATNDSSRAAIISAQSAANFIVTGVGGGLSPVGTVSGGAVFGGSFGGASFGIGGPSGGFFISGTSGVSTGAGGAGGSIASGASSPPSSPGRGGAPQVNVGAPTPLPGLPVLIFGGGMLLPSGMD